MTPSEKQDKSIGCFVDSISTFAKEALERGGGRACVATHGTGCRHYGILDMKSLDRQNFLYYSKKGGWLEGKYCLNCNVLTNDMCMDKVSKSYLRYCEMGLKSTKYVMRRSEDEIVAFEDHDCNMVLCIPCWNQKVLDYEHTSDNMNNTGRRSVRTRR